MTEPTKSPAFDVALAEFSALRQEIGNRSTAQLTLLTAHLTASGTVIGFVLQQAGAPQLLLLIPLLSFAFGMLWLDHAANISRLGALIDTDLNRRLHSESQQTIVSEGSARKFEANLVWRFFALAVPILFMFAFLPAGSLFVLRPRSPLRQTLSAKFSEWMSIFHTLWLIESVLLFVFLVFWLYVMGWPALRKLIAWVTSTRPRVLG